jgi:hypothetical protein
MESYVVIFRARPVQGVRPSIGRYRLKSMCHLALVLDLERVVIRTWTVDVKVCVCEVRVQLTENKLLIPYEIVSNRRNVTHRHCLFVA